MAEDNIYDEENYFGRLFLELCDYLTEKVPAIKWVDQDFGQLEEPHPPVIFPCCLIDFQSTPYSELSNLAQLGMPTVTFRLGDNPLSSSQSGAPVLVRKKAVEFYQLEQDVYKAVQGFFTVYTSPFNRVGADTERRNDNIRVRQLSFTTSYEDRSAVKQTIRKSAPLSVSSEIIHP